MPDEDGLKKKSSQMASDDQQQQQQQQLPGLQDLSAILQVDGSIEPGLARKRMMRDSNGRECDSQGRLIETDKWDNHNTIARGWLTSGEDHYQPVTFRRIYGAKTPSFQQQASPMPAEMKMAQPADEDDVSPQQHSVPADACGDYPEDGCADL